MMPAVPMNDPNLKNLFPSPGHVPSEFSLDWIDDGRRYLIDGAVRVWDGPAREVLSPVLSRIGIALSPVQIAEAAMLTKSEALSALEAAHRAFDHGAGPWPSLSAADRIRAIREFISAIKPMRDQVTLRMMWEIAKTHSSCISEFDRTIDYLEQTLDAFSEGLAESSRIESANGIASILRRAPIGVALCMGPYNVPLFETLCTAIPSLLMGNTVVIKLPRLGGMCILPLLDAFASCFPAGAVNIIDGDGAKVITPIMETGRVSILAFVGSFRVANTIRRAHPKPNRLRKVLGMDANNPAIILPDADLENAVACCLKGALKFNGQRCTGLKNLFVHEDLVEPFLAAFCEQVDRLPIGMPWEADTFITPMAEQDKPSWLNKLVQNAQRRGARIANNRTGSAGTLFAPTVLHPVDSTMEIANLEQFGPVAPVLPFTNIEQVIRFAMESDLGQQVSIFGNNPAEVGELVDAFSSLSARINLNTYARRGPDALPFTGRKDSAESTLSVTESLLTFSAPTIVASTEDDDELLRRISADGKSRFLKK
jgi:glyceraldehyde-3-phosphate dehydrogenase (NADP+)